MSAANKCGVELNTRREIPYLQATMYYFVYHINTNTLYWQEKPTSSMNKNKWINNPPVTIVTLKMEKYVEPWLQTNNGCNFQFTKFSFIDFVLTDRRSLSGKWPKSASGRSSCCWFSFSAERNANTKATVNTSLFFVVFLLVYWFSSHSRKVWPSLFVSDMDFLVF